jgi:hypothetical protein
MSQLKIEQKVTITVCLSCEGLGSCLERRKIGKYYKDIRKSEIY